MRFSFLFVFCLKHLTIRVFSSKRHAILLYAKVVIKTKRKRQEKAQMPDRDTELSKTETQFK